MVARARRNSLGLCHRATYGAAMGDVGVQGGGLDALAADESAVARAARSVLAAAGVVRVVAGDGDVQVDGFDEVVGRLRRDVEGAAVEQVEARDDTFYVTLAQGERRWSVQFFFDAESERVTRVGVERALPPGFEIRLARLDDNEGILDVCRNTPIVLGDTTVTIDPGDDYFALLGLMDMAGSMVATCNGRVVAVQCGTGYEVRFNGRHQRMAQILHTRVLPEFSGIGLFSILSKAMRGGQWLAGPVTPGAPKTEAQLEAMRRVERAHAAARDTAGEDVEGGRDASRKPLALNNCSYFAVENEAIKRTNVLPTWKCRPWRAVLPCDASESASASAAGGSKAPGSRVATIDDTSRIVELINACHNDEELFLEYTDAFLTRRLTRSPLYSWDDFLISDRAVVGVWAAGQRRTFERDGATEQQTRALVLDYGFVPGAEDEFGTLLAEACATAAARGMTHVSIFSSDPSPGAAKLRELAERVEVYELVTPTTGEPEGTLARGVYVDQIYF